MTMTLATPGIPARSAGPGEVFAAGSSAARRIGWLAVGAGLLVVAWADYLLGQWAPSLRGVTRVSALALAAVGVVVLTLAIWRRTKGYQVRAEGLLLVTGGAIFGDRQLLPWSSLEWFGGRRAGPDDVTLAYRQQHVARDCPLPGRRLSVHDFDRLIDRLRVVLGDRHPGLKLGGLEG